MVHVRCHHEHARLLLGVFASFYRHFLQLEDVDMVELFEKFDLPQSRDWESILLIVHKYLLQGNHCTRSS